MQRIIFGQCQVMRKPAHSALGVGQSFLWSDSSYKAASPRYLIVRVTYQDSGRMQVKLGILHFLFNII